MKYFIVIFLLINFTWLQTPVNTSAHPIVRSDKKTITATTSFFDPKQEENVILRREKRKNQIEGIEDVIIKMNNSLKLLQSKIKNRVNQMNDIIDSNLAYKEKHNLTVSNLNFNQFQNQNFISMQNQLSKNGCSFTLQNIGSDYDLRKLDKQQKSKIKDRFRIRRIDSQLKVSKYKFFKPISQLQELGPGIYYYFYFLKFFMIIFFIISLLSIISISILAKSNGLQDYNEEGIFLKTTISNSYQFFFNDQEIQEYQNLNEEQQQDYFQKKNQKNNTQFYIVMCTDFVISLLFLISIYTFQIISAKRVKSIDLKRPSARHYAIQVENLPKDNLKAEEIQQFFEQFFEVKDVAFSREFGNHFQTLVQINKIKDEIKLFLKKSQNKKKNRKYIRKRKALYNKFKSAIQKIHTDDSKKFNLTNFENFQIINAYIIFNNSKNPKQIFDIFKQAYKKSLCQQLFCRKKIIDKKYLFRGQYKIKISQPDHPGNFHWENMEYSKFFRKKRLALLYLIIFFIILLSFIFNFFLTAFTNNQEGQKCNESYDVDYIKQNQNNNQINTYVYCYCSQFPFYYIFNKNHESYNVCAQEYLNQIQSLIIVLGIAAVISLINMIIQSVIFKMVNYIKYSTLTQTVIKQINLALIAEYCNTAFVLLLIYKEIFGVAIPEVFNSLVQTDFFQLKFTSSFDRFWYILVAKKLFFPFLLLCFNPHTSEWLQCFLKGFITNIKSKYIKNKKNFIDNYQLPTFSLGYRFKNALKLIIVCFTFSSGIPLFNIFIFLGLLFTFISHKIILINYSSKVPPYSIDIIKSIFKILKMSLLIHLIFSMFLLSDTEIYPTNNMLQVNIGVIKYSQNQFFSQLFEKIYQVFPIFCLFILTLVCIFFEVFVIGITQKIIEYFSKTKISQVNTELTYDQIKKKLKKIAIPDYQILSNITYYNVLNFKKTDLQMLKTLILNKSLGQLVKLYSIDNPNLEKVTTLDQDCQEFQNQEKDLENIELEQNQDYKNQKNITIDQNQQLQQKKQRSLSNYQQNLQQTENKTLLQNDIEEFQVKNSKDNQQKIFNQILQNYFQINQSFC